MNIDHQENNDIPFDDQSLGKDLQDDLDWRITSVNIYDKKGYPIFSDNYNSEISEIDSSVVLQFYNTVQSFAKHNLKTRFVDFKVKHERIFFQISHENIYIITVKLGSKSRSGLGSDAFIQVSSFVSEVSTILYFHTAENPLEEDFELSRTIGEMVSDINKRRVVESDQVFIPELLISFALITDDTGVPFVSRSYEGSIFSDDHMLITMFLHALNVFFNTHFSDHIEEINFGNSRLYIKNQYPYFYAIMVQFDDYQDLREDSPIHRISKQILDQMTGIVDNFGEDMDSVLLTNLELMVDSFIFKAKYQLNEAFRNSFE